MALKNTRIGTDQRFALSLSNAGAKVDMHDVEVLHLCMYSVDQRSNDGSIGYAVNADDATVLDLLWPAKSQSYLGEHSVHGTIRYAGAVASFDVPAVNVVSKTSEADISTDTIVLDAPVGTEDLSATITIQGMGPQGPKGDKMTYADLTQEDKEDLYEGVSEVMKPLLNTKQDVLTDTDGSYGQRVAELEKAKQDTLTPGNGISIEGGVISSTVAEVVDNIVNAGYVFAGVATPTTNPGTPDAKVFYIANGKGTYTNFGGIEVTEDEVVVLIWDSSWRKVATGIASEDKLSELASKIVYIEGVNVTSNPMSDASSFDYSMLSVDIKTGKKFYLRINADTFSRIVICYNGENALRLLDTTDSSIVNKWIQFTAPADLTDIGIGYITPVSELSLSLKIEGKLPNLEEVVNDMTQIVLPQKDNLATTLIERKEQILTTGAAPAAPKYFMNLDDCDEILVSSYVDNPNRVMLRLFNDLNIEIATYYQRDGLLNEATGAYEIRLAVPAGAKYYTAGKYNYSAISEDDIYVVRFFKVAGVSSNILFGKRWVACGDSFTKAGYNTNDGFLPSEYSYTEGIYNGEQIVYPFIIALRNGMHLLNLAKGGMTMTDVNGSTVNSFTHGTKPVYMSIPVDADYITIKLGINDLNNGAPIGTIDSTDITTFYGAWNVALEWITTNRPFAHIGIIITNGSSAAYTDATRNIAEKWGIAYLDEVNDKKVPLLHRVDREGVSDAVKARKLAEFSVSPVITAEHPNVNIHPNVKAQYYESTFVEEFLRRL